MSELKVSLGDTVRYYLQKRKTKEDRPMRRKEGREGKMETMIRACVRRINVS